MKLLKTPMPSSSPRQVSSTESASHDSQKIGALLSQVTWLTQPNIPKTPQTADTAPIQPWYGATLPMSCAASGFLAMMRLDAAKTPSKASQIPRNIGPPFGKKWCATG